MKERKKERKRKREKEREKEKERKREKKVKGRKKESGARDIHNQTIEFNKIDEGMIRIMDWVALERMLSASFHSKFSYVQF